jgi:DNA-binding phage protein
MKIFLEVSMSKKKCGKAGQLAVRREVQGLDSLQQEALISLREGKTISETALSAGIARMTLYRWLKTDPGFQAAYNQWQEEIEQSCRARMMALSDKAADTLEAALEVGDVRAALQLLKGLGLIRARKARRLTDADEVARREAIKEKRRVAKLERAERNVETDIKTWRWLDDGVKENLARDEVKPGEPPRQKYMSLTVTEKSRTARD